MIVSGAINTIGKLEVSQLISSKIRRWSSRDSSISISFTHTCKYLLVHIGSYHVLWRIPRLDHLFRNEEERWGRIQDAFAGSQIQRERAQLQCVMAGHPCHQRPDHFDPAIRGVKLRLWVDLPDDERRSHYNNLHLFNYFPENESANQSNRR